MGNVVHTVQHFYEVRRVHENHTEFWLRKSNLDPVLPDTINLINNPALLFGWIPNHGDSSDYEKQIFFEDESKIITLSPSCHTPYMNYTQVSRELFVVMVYRYDLLAIVTYNTNFPNVIGAREAVFSIVDQLLEADFDEAYSKWHRKYFEEIAKMVWSTRRR